MNKIQNGTDMYVRSQRVWNAHTYTQTQEEHVSLIANITVINRIKLSICNMSEYANQITTTNHTMSASTMSRTRTHQPHHEHSNQSMHTNTSEHADQNTSKRSHARSTAANPRARTRTRRPATPRAFQSNYKHERALQPNYTREQYHKHINQVTNTSTVSKKARANTSTTTKPRARARQLRKMQPVTTSKQKQVNEKIPRVGE